MSITSRIGKSLRKRDWGASVIDVIVVAIGILMALAFDQYFTERNERETEQQLLSTIASDLTFSAKDLRSDSEFTLRRRDILSKFLEYTDSDIIPEEVVKDVGMAANVTESYSPTIRAYNSMISTGKLTLIKNQDILMALADINRDIENYLNYRNQTTNVWLYTLMPIWLETMKGPSSSEVYMDALKTRKFVAAIEQRATFLFFTGRQGLALVKKMQDTVKLIEQEIPDNKKVTRPGK